MEDLFKMPEGDLSNFMNPFKADGVRGGFINWFVTFQGEIIFTGQIHFQKGVTTGQQPFTAKDLGELIRQMTAFMEGLKD